MPIVAELFDAWLAHADGRLEVATVMGYRSVARQLRPLIGGRDVDSLTAAARDLRAASGTDATRRAPRLTCAATTSCSCAGGTTQYMCRWAEVTET